MVPQESVKQKKYFYLRDKNKNYLNLRKLYLKKLAQNCQLRYTLLMANLSAWIKGQFNRPEIVQIPDEGDKHDREEILRAVYLAGAAIAAADGIVDRGEIATAEQVGSLLFDDFDCEDFRTACGEISDVPAFRDQIDNLAENLSTKDKRMIFSYLFRIATADGNIAQQENELLAYTRKKWGIIS